MTSSQSKASLKLKLKFTAAVRALPINSFVYWCCLAMKTAVRVRQKMICSLA